ncbi:MAG: hypothetical protein HY692_04835, partial [Cyanobacteria bacterium NC_groundwater_1444_Ag_S-0.65um_54_12]|nr:hypothetical protein [Cyanobacteria bacterium NC_groundwater_1444_Ag_S-0.65um_54_12]
MNIASQPDLTDLLPYGDTPGDGKVQISFTLPVPAGPEAAQAAKQLLLQHQLKDPLLACMEPVGPQMSFFVMYASLRQGVDYAHLDVPKAEFTALDMGQIDDLIAERIGRKLVIVGACPGSDA